MSIIRVDLKERGYNIHAGEGILLQAGEIVASACRGRRAVIVTNPKIGKLYAGALSKSLEGAGVEADVITIPAGERYKTLRTVSSIYEKLLDMKMDRGGIAIGLGGGVVGDITGFVAATYMRGIDFVQVPTSLLAQVDASIGGKTGVDLPRGKNLVGAFHQPKTVLIDLSVLSTLPRREFRAGLAEIIKHGIIQDGEYFRFLEENPGVILRRDPCALEYVIRRSCEIKAAVVREDEREGGLRRILNYGHTAGHAVESLTGYKALLHGEAVAVGMVTAALAAREMGGAEAELVSRLSGVLASVGLPVKLPEGMDPGAVVEAMKLDKKVQSGRLNTVLVNSPGKALVADNVTPEIWHKALCAQARL
jgi:3-dehydroquinate synthase